MISPPAFARQKTVRASARQARMITHLAGAVLGLICQSVPAALAADAAYRIEALPKNHTELGRIYTREQRAVLEKLNRRDVEHLLRADPPVPGLVVPSAWQDGDLAYAPMPAMYAWAEPYRKAIVVHQPWQVFGAYEHGRLVR